MRLSIVFVGAIAASVAHADSFDPRKLTLRFVELTAGQPIDGGELKDATPPRFAFSYKAAAVSPKGFDETSTLLSDYASAGRDAVVGRSADGKSVWIATDIDYVFPCGMEGCDKIVHPEVHATGLVDAAGHAVAWHVGRVIVGSNKPPSPKLGKPIAPQPLADGIDTGAEVVAKLFKTSMADPKALAKTIADRKDAVMLGSDAGEAFVGVAKMRATLLRWNLGFTVRDGIQAGVSSTTAWVAANVDAAKPGAKTSTPYRVFAIYDKKGSEWQLVLLHFSIVTAERD